MFTIQATQIFGNKIFYKKAETLEEAKKIAKSYYVANCNTIIYDENNQIIQRGC